MGSRPTLVLVWTLACTGLASAQPAPADGVDLVFGRLQALIEGAENGAFASLIDPSADPEQIAQLTFDLFAPGVRRAIVRERDRAPLDGALPGDGYRVVAEVFTETDDRARIATVLFDLRRPHDGEPDTWRITAGQAISTVAGLFRLRIDPARQLAARNLTIRSEDLVLSLPSGSVFPIDSGEGVTGLVLLGRGAMRFSPGPEAERGQMRIFAGAETLSAEFDAVLVRFHPADYMTRVSAASLSPVAADRGQLRRAEEMFARDGPSSFSLDLSDLSPDTWYLLPPPGDFLAEIRTRRHGALTYSRAGLQPEDVTLFEREEGRTIALYPSAERLAARGLAYNEDNLRDYDVLHYDVEASLSPARGYIEGRTQVRLRVRATELTAINVRLADTLAVTGIASLQHGRLLHFRVRGQNMILVNLPTPVRRGDEVTLVVAYAGEIESQDVDGESLQFGFEDGPRIEPEAKFLLSNRAYWYPQNITTDYATATMRIVVPEGYGCVASGELRPVQDVRLRDLLSMTTGRPFVFSAADPVRYLAVVVSRFVRAGDATIELATGEARPDASGQRDTLRIAVDANPRLQGRGRQLMGEVEDIMRFYAELVGDAPYASTTIALAEDDLPGGHSPGYFALLNTQLPGSSLSWRGDPAAFSGFPEFFIAHELAHQWWGQAVGWRNYHEQWLSEGFSQYFAALYARRARGEEAFAEMLRQFRRWSLAESDEGPVYLGYRLGHIEGDSRVFRALVYNKGAAVLHMLRRLVGDEAFFSGLRRFYTEQKFQKAGTEDLRRGRGAESGMPLERFFQRWIYGAAIPRLRHASSVAAGEVTVRFRQTGELLFDVPVTVSIDYTDGRSQEVVVAITERETVRTIATDGAVRRVEVNRDHAAIAELDSW